MNKEKLVIIGANSFQNKLIEKAKAKGYETHVFAWECGDIGEKTADYFYPIDIKAKDEILAKCKALKPAGICSIASDLAVPTVNYVAGSLGLTANSEECSLISTDKYEMRKTFRDQGLPSPGFNVFEEGNDADKAAEGLNFPVIVKPTDRSGSRGVTRIDSPEELADAIRAATKESFAGKAIIEEYIEGIEYSIEYISYKGCHHFLAATRKFTSGEPHFVEMAHFQPAKLDSSQLDNVRTIIEKALDALHISHGASHSEIRIDSKGNVNIIEIGSRMGGGCIGSDLVKISTGYDFVDMVIDIACGKELKFEKVREPKKAFIRFFLSAEDRRKLDKIKADNPDCVYEITGDRPENDVLDPVSSEDRTGYYILALDSEKELDEICRFTIEEKYL